MIKLKAIAMALMEPNQKVILQDSVTGRICFEGTAEGLLDYSGIDYRKVPDIKVVDGALKLYIK